MAGHVRTRKGVRGRVGFQEGLEGGYCGGGVDCWEGGCF